MNVSSLDGALLQVVAQVLIAVLAPVLTAAATALIGYCIRWVRGKLTSDQLALADELVRLYALAADQYDLSGAMRRSGEEKKAWVVAQVQAALEARGIRMDVGMLADLVEAKVLEVVKPARMLDVVGVGAYSADLQPVGGE